MSLRLWFHTVWSGDFRLERIDDDNCMLTVEDPTRADLKLLKPFLMTAVQLDWIDSDEEPEIATKGETRIPLHVPMTTAGPLIAEKIHGDAETWTAVRYTDGSITVDSGTNIPADNTAALSTGAAAGGKDKDEVEIDSVGTPKPEAPKPEVAATIAAPRQGCPAPTACQRRSSEVLRAFCTVSQWRQWQSEGRMRVIGNYTGKAYHVYHRDEASRRRLTHSLVEASTGHDVCIWDDSVPPEEEALAIKLAVEHKERWLMQQRRGPGRIEHDVDRMRMS